MKQTSQPDVPLVLNLTSEHVARNNTPLLNSFQGLSGRIGIYGGSFDPIHNDHLELARAIKQAYNLDLVVFVPTAQNPLKKSSPQSTDFDRLEMIYSALEAQEDPGLLVSPIEIIKPGPNYTVDTLQEIKSQVATDCKLFFVMGSDCIKSLPAWKNVTKIFSLADVLISDRDGNALTDLEQVRTQLDQDVVKRIENNLFSSAGTKELSSSYIRNSIGTTGLVPENSTDPWVSQYIQDRGLYAKSGPWPKFLEKQRKPHAHEPQKIDPARMTFCVKASRYQRDLTESGLTHEQLFERYRSTEDDPQGILDGHKRQLVALAKLKAAFPQSRFIDYNAVKTNSWEGTDLVIALGGDEHFKYVASYVKDKFILGINSDPERSNGALHYYNADSFIENFEKLLGGQFLVEEWTRVTGTINGNPINLAIDNLFIGNRFRRDISKHTLNFNGQHVHQKGSGLLVTTGAGSTGWYDSAVRYLYPHGNPFPKTEQKLCLLLTEPFHGRLNSTELKHITISKNDELVIESMGNSDTIVSTDSLTDYDFPRGSKLIVKFSTQPLKVIVLS